MAGRPGAPAPAPPAPTTGIAPLAFVEVNGPVARPGVYAFPRPPSLGDVWQRAGAPGAAPVRDQIIPSGSRVEVTPEGGFRLAAMSGAQLITLGLPLDLNRAGAPDLEAVPGIGPELARRMVDYRQRHGPFKQIDDLADNVSGFGPEKLRRVRPHLTLAPPGDRN